MINVLLVDDYPIMQQLLRDILQRYPDICVVGEAQNGEDAVVQSIKLKPTVVIIDINLPTISGVEATRLIKLQRPSTVVVGLTAGVPDQTVTVMRDAGAAAVLSKGDLLSALYPTIIEAMRSSAKQAFASASASPKH
jgi:DNA-binding NarL/FixJ family response regulator